MVWPILISVAVTPRISADIAAAGSIRQATAPSAPTPVTKRIGFPPPVSSAALKGARSGRYLFRRVGTCHDAATDANPNHEGGRRLGGASQPLRRHRIGHQRLNAGPVKRHNEEQIDLAGEIMHQADRRDDDALRIALLQPKHGEPE